MASSDSYKKVAGAVVTDANYADLGTQFTTAAGKTSVADIKDAITDTGAAGTAVKDAITAWAAAGDDLATIKDKLAKVASAYADLRTARDGVKDGIVAEGIAADGTAVAGKAYDTYKKDETSLDTAKTNYYTKAGPKLLEGKTVGVAASDDTVGTASGENAITITANKEGIGGQISGLNISISDSQGNVKKSANAALDAFEETIRAQNKSDDNAISLQVGAKANQSIKVGLTDMRAEALGLQGADGTKLNISTQTKANAAINVLDNAIQKALDQQTTIGSVESRLEYTSSNLTTASENVQASESTIRDADMAKEMTEYTKNNVLLQAAQSMLAQANQSSSNVLSLLQ